MARMKCVLLDRFDGSVCAHDMPMALANARNSLDVWTEREGGRSPKAPVLLGFVRLWYNGAFSYL